MDWREDRHSRIIPNGNESGCTVLKGAGGQNLAGKKIPSMGPPRIDWGNHGGGWIGHLLHSLGQRGSSAGKKNYIKSNTQYPKG